MNRSYSVETSSGYAAHPRQATTPQLATYDVVFDLQPDPSADPSAVSPTLDLTAQVAAPVAIEIAQAVGGVCVLSTLTAFGAYADCLTPTCVLRLLTTPDRAIAIAAGIGLAAHQEQVIVSASNGRSHRALDVVFLDGRSTGDPASLAPFWKGCRAVAKGRITGAFPVRLRQHDGLRILDLNNEWPSSEEAREWVSAAAWQHRRKVVVRERRSAFTVVCNDWSRDREGEAFQQRLVATGRESVAIQALKAGRAAVARLVDPADLSPRGVDDQVPPPQAA